MLILCKCCLDGINSRGENLFSRHLESEVETNEDDLVQCDWCEDYFEYDEMYEAF